MVEINPYEIVMQIINFGVLFWLLKKYLYKPLSAFLDKRADEIANNIDSAKQLNEEAIVKVDEAKEEILKAKNEAKEIVSQAVETGLKEKAHIINNTEAKVKEMFDQGKEEINRNLSQAKHELKGQIADIAIDIASKIAEKNINKEENERLIKDHIYEISEL